MSSVDPTLRLRLSSVLYVSEQRGWWIRGRLRRDESVVFELCFQDTRKPDIAMAEGVPIVYLGFFSDEVCLFEFQNGVVFRRPAAGFFEDVFSISVALTGYNHYNAARKQEYEKILAGDKREETERRLVSHGGLGGSGGVLRVSTRRGRFGSS